MPSICPRCPILIVAFRMGLQHFFYIDELLTDTSVLDQPDCFLVLNSAAPLRRDARPFQVTDRRVVQNFKKLPMLAPILNLG